MHDPYTRPKGAERAMLAQSVTIEPENFHAAKGRSDWPIWRKAMEDEYSQLSSSKTWQMVDLPDGRKTVGCRWVYATKTNPDGSFQKAKARLVAQGFTQQPGMDYYEISSPVVKFDSLRTILAIANTHDWE